MAVFTACTLGGIAERRARVHNAEDRLKDTQGGRGVFFADCRKSVHQDMMMPYIGKHVYVSGCVQGVAFRYTALRQAKGLGVCGWVKNLPDGRVELLIEGEQSSVEQMVEWCRQGPRSAHVTDVRIETFPYSGEHHSFSVALYSFS